MEYKDLSFSFEQLQEFLGTHNVLQDEMDIQMLRTLNEDIENELIIRPEYYYGDSILAFNFVLKNNKTGVVRNFRWEVIY